MQRVLCMALAAIMLLSLAACGDDRERPTDAVETAAVTESEPVTDATVEKPTIGRHDVISLDFIKTFDQTPAIEPQTVYEENDLIVTAEKIEYDTVSGPQIILSVKNNTQDEVLIQNAYTVVNGFMMKPDVNIRVSAGKTTQKPMSLSYLGLAMAGIRSLSEIEFSLQILNSSTYAVIDTTPTVKLAMTSTAEEQTPFDEEGQVVYDQKGVKVILQGIKNDTLFENGSVLMVYMVNDTDKTVSVLNSKLTVNGYDITTAMQTVILPGKRAVDKIELYDNELDEYGIASLDTVDVGFEINDYEEWKVIGTTDTISVELSTEPPTDAPTDIPADTQPTE